MPDRILRAGILTSDGVNSLSWASEVFYRRLMSVVDDFGRYDGRASVLRAALYALKVNRVSEPDIGKWIRECEEAGLVRRYTVDSKPYLELLKFGQKVRALKSKWPDPPTCANSCQQVSADASVVVSGFVVEGDKKASSGKPDVPAGFVRFWTAWPKSERKQGKAKCLAIWKRKKLEAQSDAIVAHVEKMAQSESWRTGYDPMPETYLNGDRWDGAELDAPQSRRKPWFIESWSAIEAKAKELNLTQSHGEPSPTFKRRVMAAAGVTDEDVTKAEAEWQ